MVDDDDENDDAIAWRPFTQGGFLDIDTDELVGFGEEDDWDLLEHDDDFDEDGNFVFSDDEVWVSDGMDGDDDFA